MSNMGEEFRNEAQIDADYLPYSPEQLLTHFAPVAGADPSDRFLAYYLSSKANRDAFVQTEKDAGVPTTNFTLMRRGRQMEKDERFWIVAALMALFEQADNPINAFSALLTKCFGSIPPMAAFDTWADALGTERELKLFFEANLASPISYRLDLQQNPEDHLLAIPYIREASESRRSRLEGRTKVGRLEGPTKVENVRLIAPGTGFTVLFEAKVMSDVSCQIEFDTRRNQLARNIDVMLEPPSSRNDFSSE